MTSHLPSPPPPPAMSGHLSFPSTQGFQPMYQRNNKRSGHKNLRCFPDCCQGIHTETGFCGSAVHVTFQVHSTPQDHQTYHVLGRFAPLISGVPLWHTFTTLPPSTDSDWYFGECVYQVDNTLTYGLNTALKGWHYGWSSSRHTSETQHVLCVYAVVVLPDASVHCVHRIHSPSFRLVSRRRANTIKLHTRAGRPIKLRRLVTDAAALGPLHMAPPQPPPPQPLPFVVPPGNPSIDAASEAKAVDDDFGFVAHLMDDLDDPGAAAFAPNHRDDGYKSE